MKTLLLTLIVTLGNVFAGQLNDIIKECEAISYAHKRECVVESSVESFMTTKLDISARDIIEIKKISSKDYTTLRAKVGNKLNYALYSIVEPVLIGQMSMTKNNGTIAMYEVEFYRDNQLCTVQLKTKLTTLDQYSLEKTKIVVKQKYAPLCN